MKAEPDKGGDRLARLFGFAWESGDWAGAILLLWSLLIFFEPVIFRGMVFYLRDICSEIVPKRTLLAHSGLEFLWNPYMFFGLPAAANMQDSVFYPLNFIFHLGAGSIPRALSFYIIFHFGISLAFGYALIRALKGPVAAALCGALAFTYGGFFVSLGNQVVVLNSAAWIMPLLWAAALALFTGRKGFVIAAGMFWALMVLGGEPEIAYLSGIILVIFFAGLIAGADLPLSRREAVKRSACIILAALLIALGLSAAQWLLTLELAGLSNRAGGLTWDDALKWSLEPKALLTLLVPNFIPDLSTNKWWALGFQNSQMPYLLSVYPGVSVLFLAALGFSRKKREGWVFAAGALIFILLGLGASGGLYKIFYYLLPGFNRFRIPERLMYGFAALLPLLAAAGAARLGAAAEINGREERENSSSSKTAALLGAMLLLAAAIVVALFLRHVPEPKSPQDYLPYHFELLRLSGLRSALFIMLSCVLLVSARTRPGLAKWAGFIMAGVIFLDLFAAHRFVCPVTDPGFYSLAGNLAERLPGDGRDERVLIVGPSDKAERMLGAGRTAAEFFHQDRLILQGFVNLELGLREVGSKSSFYPADVDVWLGLLPGLRERLLALSGVRWVLRPGRDPKETAAALPRAFVVPAAKWVAGSSDALKALEDPGFDPRSYALLEGPPPAEEPPRLDNIFWPMRITRESPERVEVQLEPKHPGYLVLLDSFYPGWRARVNGREAGIYRANGFFRAVAVGPEGGRVEFYYRPARFLIGASVSLLTLILCLALMLRGRGGLLWWAGWIIILVVLPMDNGGTTYLPVTALRIMALAMAAAWAWRLGRGGPAEFYRTRIDLWVMAFWFLAAFALLRSSYFYISLYWYLNIFTMVVLFYFTVQFTAGSHEEGPRRRSGVWLVIVSGYAVQAAWATVESFGTAQRAAAGYFNPGFLAGALMAVSPYALAKGLEAVREGVAAKASLPKLIMRGAGWGAVFALLATGILATQSRAVIIWPLPLIMVGLPGVGGILAARGASAKKARLGAALALALAMVIGLAALAVFPNPLKERARTLKYDPYAFERARIWKSGLTMIRDHPLGVGLGMFKYYFYRYNFPIDSVMAGRYEKRATDAHSEYIGLAAEMSPLGPVFLAAPALLLVLGSWRQGRGRPRESEVLGAGAGLLAIALHALFDSNLHNQSIAALAAVLAGMLTSELSRSKAGWTMARSAGRAGQWAIRVLFTILFLAGGLGYLYLGYGYGLSFQATEERDPGKALLRLGETAKYAAGNANHFKELANALFVQAKTERDAKLLAQGIKAADAGIALNPVDPELWKWKGRCLMELSGVSGESEVLDRARTAFSRALALNPFDPDSALEMAAIEKERGNRQGEIAWLEQALALEPFDLVARARLARALMDAGRTREAVRQGEEFQARKNQVMEKLKKDPNAFNTPYRFARISVPQEELLELAELFKKAASNSGAPAKVNAKPQ